MSAVANTSLIEQSRLFVTGAAWTTPLGDDLQGVWRRLLNGESGLNPLPCEYRLRNLLAAAVARPSMDQAAAERLIKMATLTVLRALSDAGEDPGDPGLQLVIGTSLGAYLEEGGRMVPLSGWAQCVRDAVGLALEPIVVSTACSSGSDAILVGAELLRAGAAKICVCGGVDVLTGTKRLAHSSLGTMSPTTLRAFDMRHDGTLLGEGAGFIVLRAGEPARSPMGLLVGSGSANDATGMTAANANGEGAKGALERSLSDARLAAAAIGLVSAHGSGTPMNDLTERCAFAEVFSRGVGPLVFATKGNFGHSLGATGAIEAITVLLALEAGKAPPIFGLEDPDQEFTLPLSQGKSTDHDARFGLSLTLGFGGFDTSLIFEAAP